MDIEYPEFYERKRIKKYNERVNQAITGYNQRALTIEEQIQLQVGMAGSYYCCFCSFWKGIFG